MGSGLGTAGTAAASRARLAAGWAALAAAAAFRLSISIAAVALAAAARSALRSALAVAALWGRVRDRHLETQGQGPDGLRAQPMPNSLCRPALFNRIRNVVALNGSRVSVLSTMVARSGLCEYASACDHPHPTGAVHHAGSARGGVRPTQHHRNYGQRKAQMFFSASFGYSPVHVAM